MRSSWDMGRWVLGWVRLRVPVRGGLKVSAGKRRGNRVDSQKDAV